VVRVTFHLVCHDCTFEFVLDDYDVSMMGEEIHNGLTGHDVECSKIE